MPFTIYSIFKAGLLVTNAVTILHPKRFLARYGFDQQNIDANPLKNQAVAFLQATSFLKVPLITINLIVIVIEIIAGG